MPFEEKLLPLPRQRKKRLGSVPKASSRSFLGCNPSEPLEAEKRPPAELRSPLFSSTLFLEGNFLPASFLEGNFNPESVSRFIDTRPSRWPAPPLTRGVCPASERTSEPVLQQETRGKGFYFEHVHPGQGKLCFLPSAYAIGARHPPCDIARSENGD